MKLPWIEQILIRDLEGIKAELAAFPDEASVWAQPKGITNSAGTLALHLVGNIRWFIGAKLGNDGYVRDRDREFAARGIDRATLTAELDRAIAAVRAALGPRASIDLDRVFPDAVGGKFRVDTGDWLIHLATHLAFHLGQVGYLRRQLTGSDQPTDQMAIGRLASAVRIA